MAQVSHSRHAIVIGGGITGLSAAYRLVSDARRRGLPLRVTLLEATARLGGAIATSRQAGCLLEQGPDCFLATKPGAVELCQELGLSAELIATHAAAQRSYVLRGPRLVPVPQGFSQTAPAALWAFATTPLFSLRGKLRMCLDLILPRKRGGGEETLAQFVRRRLGKEALDRLIQPMVAGIYTADPERLSLQATLPQILEMERIHGSVIKALWKQGRVSKRTGAGTPGVGGPRYALFRTLRPGMQGLIEALAACLPGGCAALASRVVGLWRSPEAGGWRVQLEGGDSLDADGVCLALPAPQAAPLLEGAHAGLAKALAQIPYASVATLNLVFSQAAVGYPLDGAGFVVPVKEGRSLMACTFSSSKFEGRAPQGKVVLRAFVGGGLQPQAYALSDGTMREVVLKELGEILHITGPPEEVLVTRHPHTMPQYHVGHLTLVARIEGMAAELPGLALAGNAYHGVGVPDCIHSAGRAASTLLDYLKAI